MNELPEGDTHEKRMEELKCTLSTIAKHVSSLITDAENRARDGDSPNPTARGGQGTIPTAATPITLSVIASTRVEAARAAAGTITTTVPTAASARGASPPLPPLLKPTITVGESEDIGSLQHRDDMVVVEPQSFPAAIGGGGGCQEQGGMPPLEVTSMATPTAGCAVPAVVADAAGKTLTAEVPARTRVLRRVSSVRELFLGVEKEGERLANFSQQMGLPHDTVVAHVRVRRLYGKKTAALARVDLNYFYD